jgi:uncharacterized protein
MAIKIHDIPPEGLTLELSENIRILDESAAPTGCSAVLTITPRSGSLLHIRGRVKASQTLQCSRCLASFDYPVDAEMDFELAPVTSVGPAEEHEHELSRAELDREFYEGDEIDPLGIVREQVLLALPMVPVHRSDCKGLCTVCGTDLNAGECGCDRSARGESAFSALKDLFKKKK